MVSIANYRERYRSDVTRMDEEFARRLRDHEDVLRETACVVLDDGVFAGAGFLSLSDSGSGSGERDAMQCVDAEFKALPGTETEAEASVLLLEELKYRFRRLPQTEGRRTALRVWVRAEDTAYTELLYDEGFAVGRVMTVMTRGIDETDGRTEDEDVCAEREEEARGPAYESAFSGEREFDKAPGDVEVREFFDSDEEEWRQYFAVNSRSFGEPDSEHEMRFRLKNPEAHVWIAVTDDRLVAAVSARPVGNGLYATDNIFCDPEYRRRGITTRLLRYAFGKLCDAGARSVRLTVYGDNLPAIRLYRKLGYEVSYELLEMHYFR